MTTSSSQIITLTLTLDDSVKAERLDKCISARDDTLTRTRVQQLIVQGNVQVNEKIITSTSASVANGDKIIITIPPAAPATMQPADIPLEVVYEDDDFLVINKPAGMTVHPGAGNHQDTMANALLHHCKGKLSGIGGVERPGIVHRLDKDTSGLIASAKHDQAHQHLSAQLSSRTLKRTYLALCWGVPNPAHGHIDAPIGRSHRHRKKMAVVGNGRQAITHYQIKRIFGNHTASLVECRLETGRTHQIRVHMTHIGHPLIGDASYGNQRKWSASLPADIQEQIALFARQALHAWKLGIDKPSDNSHISLECGLPQDFENVICALEQLDTCKK